MPKRRKDKPKRTPRPPRSNEQLAVASSLTVPEVESLNRWSHNRVYHLIAAGLLQSYKVGRRRYVTRRALDRCLERLESASAEPA